MVYLIHLEYKLKHSQHYIGFTPNKTSKKRLQKHRDGYGSKFLAACNREGINYAIVREWPEGDRTFERKLKNRKNAKNLCPICLNNKNQIKMNQFKFRYVVGFLFSNNMQTVALIRKAKPKWQEGRLNGIGGHIEEGEDPLDCMVREFHEETSVETKRDDWQLFCHGVGPKESVELFFYRMKDDVNKTHLRELKTMTVEPVYEWFVEDVINSRFTTGDLCKTVPNLPMLLEMAMNPEIESAELVMNFKGD